MSLPGRRHIPCHQTSSALHPLLFLQPLSFPDEGKNINKKIDFFSPIHSTTDQLLWSNLIVLRLCASGISESQPLWFGVGLTPASWPCPSMLQTGGVLPLLFHSTVGTLNRNRIPTETHTHRNKTSHMGNNRTHMQTKTSKKIFNGEIVEIT